jgi:aldehyde:ferredoxin oxidoreductase
MDQNHRAFHEFGTGAAMQGKSLEGGMPTLNYRLGAFEQTGKVDAIAVRDQMRVEMKACYACSVRCKKVVHIEEKEERARELSESLYKGKAQVAFDPKGRYSVDPKYGGPEYESLAALGVNLGSRTSSPSASRTRCATTSRWTRCRSAPRWRGRWSASSAACSRWRTPAACRCSSTTPTA